MLPDCVAVPRTGPLPLRPSVTVAAPLATVATETPTSSLISEIVWSRASSSAFEAPLALPDAISWFCVLRSVTKRLLRSRVSFDVCCQIVSRRSPRSRDNCTNPSASALPLVSATLRAARSAGAWATPFSPSKNPAMK